MVVAQRRLQGSIDRSRQRGEAECLVILQPTILGLHDQSGTIVFALESLVMSHVMGLPTIYMSNYLHSGNETAAM